MYLAMNRFKIKPGSEQEFIDVWKERESFLEEVPGFKSFNLLKGPATDEFTLFASHSVWESEEAFINWTHSEAFAKAHAQAGTKTRDIYLGPPNLECFDSVM